MSRFSLRSDGRVQMADYDQAPGFSSFLPGLAGPLGTPLWAFTCNRGQGISSFGINHKGDSILPFQPANLAYEDTPAKGFRTFLLVDGQYTEPFSPLEAGHHRRMLLGENSLELTEENKQTGLVVAVSYTSLPGEPVGGLLRGLTIRNTGKSPLKISGLDGLARVLPYGLALGQYKEMGNLFKSWAQVDSTPEGALLYHLRSSTEDTAQVSEVSGSFFFASAHEGRMQSLVYDPVLVFGPDAPLLRAQAFERDGLSALRVAKQQGENRLACAFCAFEVELAPGAQFQLDSLIGYAPTPGQLSPVITRFLQPGYAQGKRAEAEALVKGLLADVTTATAHKQFDAYIRQCYLDNFQRGGYPQLMGGKVVHLYSRKHGDPERDYNWFVTTAEPYSQGNGNFRDVCQNRRMDVSLHPEVGDFNVHSFYSLIQMDGYNPLEIRPSRFALQEGVDAHSLLAELGDDAAPLLSLLSRPFTPGEAALAARQAGMIDIPALVDKLLAQSDQQFEAGFLEGYWSDHWTYLLDLVEDYLQVYPERQEALLINRADYRFFHSGAQVRPRRDTCCQTAQGIRRYDALDTSAAVHHTRWLKDQAGDTVTTNLLGKMLLLALTKAASLDPEGLGISMEGGRPGWNDAMNGLPGLFGSGMAETVELRRHLRFMLALPAGHTDLPAEMAHFMQGLTAALKLEQPFLRWDAANSLVETFRAATANSVSGERVSLSLNDLRPFLSLALERVEQGIARAYKIGQGILPTYFTYEATAWQPQEEAGEPRLSASGLPLVTVTAFKRHEVPAFLEGPARQLASLGDSEEERAQAADIAEAVVASELYDPVLHMYLTSVPLNAMSMELGRIRAFTPGWLERESVFLHMAYKYLLGLLKTGQEEAFWAAAPAGLIPFMDPDTYGRSTLENSSFIASSRNPDPALWGRGFVARLSGSTMEMLSIHQRIFWGNGGMALQDDGQPVFRFDPRLPDWLYDGEGKAMFTLFSRCQVVLHKVPGESGPLLVRALSYQLDGQHHTLSGDTLPHGQALREGRINRVDVYLNKGERI